MTLMPSRHVRDPRRRYRAHKIRKLIESSVPPLVEFHVPPELISRLVALPAHARTQALLRINREQGSPYTEFVIRALVEALKEKS